MAFSLFERWSPEYALNNAIDDVKESGLEGLKKHLTANAFKNIHSIETISGRPGICCREIIPNKAEEGCDMI